MEKPTTERAEKSQLQQDIASIDVFEEQNTSSRPLNGADDRSTANYLQDQEETQNGQTRGKPSLS